MRILVLLATNPTIFMFLFTPWSYTFRFLSNSESDGYRPGFCKLEVELPPHKTFTVVPATFRAGQQGPYFLTIGSHENIHPTLAY
eukprot:m.176320 g.176320  ORF g.176320 m.176320 type:complete len:85 (+) comp16559_c1_seq4:2464-2718(+)